MGLYLCVFDNEEIDGIDVGSYSDFNYFRDLIVTYVEKNIPGSICPTLINHMDSDGTWTPQESGSLLRELDQVEKLFRSLPPMEYNSSWKRETDKIFGIAPKSLYECFFDVDGEPLIEQIKRLARISIDKDLPILFQ